MSVIRTPPVFARVRAQPRPANPPPTITTCAFGLLVSTLNPPVSASNRVAGTRLQELRDQSGPSRLVRRPYSSARVAIEVLIEVEIVAELAILLELRIKRVHLSHAIRVLQEDPCEPIRQVFRDLIDRE